MDAKACGAIKTVRPRHDALRRTTAFYLADAAYDDALSLAGERDG